MYQNYFILKLRTILRKLGLTKIIGKLLSKKDYEKLFENALLTNINANDIIYDIGANQGWYTNKFLEKATEGKVFAFEPVPICLNSIKKLQSNYTNLIICPIAVGSKKGVFPMSIGEDALNATSSLKTVKEAGDIMVHVETLDDIVASNNSVPNVIKIDVEGFELDVLNGMPSTLKNKQVKILAIEIHFKLLENKGYKNGSKLIVKKLKQNGFKIKWIDHSHIIAKRGR